MPLGFQFIKFLKPRDWRIIEIVKDTPMSEYCFCPADGMALKTICRLIGLKQGVLVRIGCCPACGYTGYIDRPSHLWMENFYMQHWNTNTAGEIDVASEAKRRKKEIETGEFSYRKKTHMELMENFLRQYEISRKRPILEIGCGYGMSLQYLYLQGFSNIVGVEPSPRRAAVARSAYNLTVCDTIFEREATQEFLRRRAPFGLIFAHHVIEHVYDPVEIFSKVSVLQCPGDYFIISVPNLFSEPTMQTLMYIPHLHSFTKESLQRLFARYCYVVEELITTSEELFVIGRKESSLTDNSKSIFVESNAGRINYFELVRMKFMDNLDLGRSAFIGRNILWWYRPLGIDKGGRFPYVAMPIENNEKRYAALLTRWLWYRNRISAPLQMALITNINTHYGGLKNKEEIIDIQFNDAIQFAYK